MQTHEPTEPDARTAELTELKLGSTCQADGCARDDHLEDVVVHREAGVTFLRQLCRYHLKHYLGVSS